jgi:[glutamine synthetase] adenylyltransferase / [glutamine synthetase]-adenylyl-L-tyrosine phosphorylase
MMLPQEIVFRDAVRATQTWQKWSSRATADAVRQVQAALRHAVDPDLALNCLERLTASGVSYDGPGRDADALTSVIPLLGASPFLGDVLIAQPGMMTTLLQTPRYGPYAEELITEIAREIAAAPDDAHALRAIRLFRQRQMLRIGFNDIVRERPLEEIVLDLSNAADACIAAALQIALKTIMAKFGTPLVDGRPSRCVALAFGKLGGSELNYSSDIDLMLVYDEEGQTTGKRAISLQEFYSRVVPEWVRLLSAHTDSGLAYRVDLRLRPEGASGPLARSLASTLRYYDTLGRTWERQALIKLRPVAGDLALGQEFLQAVEPFVYRKYLNFAEINEIKAMKRRIEQKTQKAGLDARDVKTGRGGIRDIEFTIQYLQLLNGGELPNVRKRSTVAAIIALEEAGCLTFAECQSLDDAYRFLRKTEHRLQLLFDLQTHRLPEGADELRRLALRMGYTQKVLPRAAVFRRTTEETTAGNAPQRFSRIDESSLPTLDTRMLLVEPLDQFLHDYAEKTKLDRTILDHLLHECFQGMADQAEPETDLVLDPDPGERLIAEILGRYPFRNVQAAYGNLMRLAQESALFLSTRRCRHFLASTAPALLRAVAATPDPDLALENLARVTDSLGGKAVLWELFRFNPPSLKLVVDLCSHSPFLSEILVDNPGMIDELLDSLVLNQPRTLNELDEELGMLIRGVDRPDAVGSILHSFQDKEILRIGVRDLLGKDRINETTAAVSDVAECLLKAIFERGRPSRLGVPTLANGAPCRFVLLALGKLGGREMSYHSDLDVILVYEGDGQTQPGPDTVYFRGADNFVYFTEYAQRVIRATGQMGAHGKLYSVDMRLRPTGKSGSLVVPLEAFDRYYAEGGAQIWERQAMTRARPLLGDAGFTEIVLDSIRRAITGVPWGVGVLEEIRAMRRRLECNTTNRNLKRGPGGIVDVEFAVQLLQLKYGKGQPHILKSNAWEALDAAFQTGVLSPDEHQAFKRGYSFLRQVESRLRIVTNRATNEFPEAEEELDKLAKRLGIAGMRDARDFREEHQRVTNGIRRSYESLILREQD